MRPVSFDPQMDLRAEIYDLYVVRCAFLRKFLPLFALLAAEQGNNTYQTGRPAPPVSGSLLHGANKGR